MHAESAGASILAAKPELLVQRDAEQHAFRAIAGQTASGMVWTGAALLIGFALKVLLTRKMLPREMGIVLTTQSFVGLAVAVATLGIPDAVVRFLGIEATPEGAPRRTVHVAMKVVSVATVAVMLVAMAVLPWLGTTMSADALWATMLMTLALPLLALADVIGASYRGVNRLGTKILMIDVLRPGIVVIALLLSPLVLTRSAPYVAGVFAGAALVMLTAVWIFFRTDRRWQNGGGVTAFELLRFGIPLAGAVLLAGPVINNLLPLMLSASTGPAAVAFYTVALSLYALVYLPVGILEQAVIPTWARMAAHPHVDNNLAASFQRYTNLGFAGATALGLVIIANDEALLTILFGPQFQAAAWALRVAIVATLCATLVGPNEGMLHALGLTGTIFHARLVAAVLGVATAAVLIPAHGLLGAVGAFGVTAVGVSAIYAVTLHSKARIHPFTWAHLMTTGIAAVGVVAATVVSSAYPVGGWVAANSLALLVLVVNPDFRMAVKHVVRP